MLLQIGKITLQGDLVLPPHTNALIIFAHGSGSSRLSPRNRSVASYLNKGGVGTLLFDLLMEDEDEELRFDIPLLAKRLIAVTELISKERKGLKIGYFGASTGAAAALRAAAALKERIGAVVSRGGRPDLALDVLDQVKAPTLLLVGSADEPVITMNETALNALQCEKKLTIVPGATHLFEEPGTLERVSELALDWFIAKLF